MKPVTAQNRTRIYPYTSSPLTWRSRKPKRKPAAKKQRGRRDKSHER